jgi:hypothetical protein
MRLRPNDLAWRRAGDEVVVLDLIRSSYHALNRSGSLLWEHLIDWATADDLAGVLERSFDLDLDAATRDVTLFLDACGAAGLLEVRADS